MSVLAKCETVVAFAKWNLSSFGHLCSPKSMLLDVRVRQMRNCRRFWTSAFTKCKTLVGFGRRGSPTAKLSSFLDVWAHMGSHCLGSSDFCLACESWVDSCVGQDPITEAERTAPSGTPLGFIRQWKAARAHRCSLDGLFVVFVYAILCDCATCRLDAWLPCQESECLVRVPAKDCADLGAGSRV